MPPAFTRGVVPVRTLVPGGVRHPHPFHKKCEEWNCKHRKINYLTLSEIRTPPVPALAQGHPPHKCGGQGRVPHPPAHHSTNSSTNSHFLPAALAGSLNSSLPDAHSAVPGELFSKKPLTNEKKSSKIAPTFIEQGCEGKSKPADAVQRAPVGGKGYG